NSPSLNPAVPRKSLAKRRYFRQSVEIILCDVHEHADTPHLPGLLRPRRQRPRRSAAQPRDELPPSHLWSLALIGGAYRGEVGREPADAEQVPRAGVTPAELSEPGVRLRVEALRPRGDAPGALQKAAGAFFRVGLRQ